MRLDQVGRLENRTQVYVSVCIAIPRISIRIRSDVCHLMGLPDSPSTEEVSEI